MTSEPVGRRRGDANASSLPSFAPQLLRTRPTPCCFFTSRGLGKKRPCRGRRLDAGGRRGRLVVCMAALIRTWLLFLHTGRGRLNEPLGVDYDTCAKPMNRLRMVVGARLTNWKGDGAYVFQALHAIHVDVRPSHFVRFTSCDGGTTKQREGKSSLPPLPSPPPPF